jgi:hypothetical protein
MVTESGSTGRTKGRCVSDTHTDVPMALDPFDPYHFEMMDAEPVSNPEGAKANANCDQHSRVVTTKSPLNSVPTDLWNDLRECNRPSSNTAIHVEVLDLAGLEFA